MISYLYADYDDVLITMTFVSAHRRQMQVIMLCYLCVDFTCSFTCCGIYMLTSEARIDGMSQLQTIVNGSASKRTEFVYNIDDVANRSAIRLRASRNS